MKVLHLADIHWRGLSRHKEYKESFEDFFTKARQLKPDIIYIGGDIVHSKTQGISPELIDHLCWWFKSLSDIAPTHVILGNHDGLVLNNDRQDAITPIVEALDLDNLFLYKKSGVYPIQGFENFNWCVFSCFDEEGWKDIYIDPNKINIALFHGAVWGSKTDVDWDIEGDVTSDLFEDFDFAMLGDIHKQQFLNDEKTIAYCGSSIQQNYGEDTGKGFLEWNIRGKKDFDVSFHEIFHSKPFITVEWKKTVAETVRKCFDYPDGSRFRIKSEVQLNQIDSKQLQHEIKREKLAEEVVFKSDSSIGVSSFKAGKETINRENLRDARTHKSLIRDYYKSKDLDKKFFSSFDTFIEKYISQISDEKESLRNTRWQINSLSFDNLFSYGKGNYINFNSIPGVTGIFGKNTRGKSSIIGALMYGMFNTSDRGSIKNLHLINSRKNTGSATVEITLNGEPLRISRKTIKHQTRKGEVYASTSLKIQRIDSNGNVIEDLTDEQRRETEKILRRMIGNSEDFMMTSLASQGGMNTFIKEGASSRKLILTKFLDLDVFEKMHDLAKSDSQDIRSKVRHYPNLDWDEEIDNTKFLMMESKKSLKKLNADLESKRNILNSLQISLATSSNPDVVTQEEFQSQEEKVKVKEAEIVKVKSRKDSLSQEISSLSGKIEKIDSVTDSFAIQDLRDRLIAQKDLERSIVTLRHMYSVEKEELKRKKRKIEKLGEVPCGDTFPTCKFIKDSHKEKGLIDVQIEKVDTAKESLSEAESSYAILRDEKLSEKIEKYDALLRKKGELSVEMSKLAIEFNNEKNLEQAFVQDLSSMKRLLEEMESKVVSDSESSPSLTLREKIFNLKEDIQKIDKERTSVLESLAKYKLNLSDLRHKRAEFKKIRDELDSYDLFLQAVSKKGIPLQIMMSQLPVINHEISKILLGVTDFTVELEASSESNSMDIFINYGDSRRIIELASGMEKMMSSLAIRVALINVSSLTKTNMLIIDEGFGALDASNIEACSRLLVSLKKWFKNILIISHVDAIKDTVDNSLEIMKDGKDAKVYCQ